MTKIDSASSAIKFVLLIKMMYQPTWSMSDGIVQMDLFLFETNKNYTNEPDFKHLQGILWGP